MYFGIFAYIEGNKFPTAYQIIQVKNIFVIEIFIVWYKYLFID